MLRAVVLVIFLIPWTIWWGSWACVFGVLGSKRAVTFGIKTWSRGILIFAGVRLRVKEHAPLDIARPCVYLANHQSALDIPILLVTTPGARNVRFMAKEELFKIPFIGWGMSRSGFIPIRRENPRHSAEVFKGVTESKGKAQHSYVIFPEGTRSPDGRLQPLKSGTMGLVVRLGFPIVPVTIVDACRANPKKEKKLRGGEVHVVFHEPIELPAPDAEGKVNRELRDTLIQQVYAVIASALPEDQLPENTSDSASIREGADVSSTS